MSGLYLLIVVLAKQYHASSFAIGVIFAVAAIGGIVGAVLSAKLHKRYRLKQLLVGICILSLLVMVLYFAVSNIMFIALVTALFYAIDPFWEVSTGAHPVVIVPDYIRGRVLSLTRMVLLAANSFGLFATGLVIHYFGTDWTIGFYSVVLLVLLVAVKSNTRLAEY
jgi:predicted MFS family arabinose efflux permease